MINYPPKCEHCGSKGVCLWGEQNPEEAEVNAKPPCISFREYERRVRRMRGQGIGGGPNYFGIATLCTVAVTIILLIVWIGGRA